MEFWINDCGHYFEIVKVHPADDLASTWYKIILDAETVGCYRTKYSAAHALADLILAIGN